MCLLSHMNSYMILFISKDGETVTIALSMYIFAIVHRINPSLRFNGMGYFVGI